MKETFFGIILLVAVVAGLGQLSFSMYEHFSPKYAAVDNKVFHESQAYNDGMIRDLENLRLQYIAGNDAVKAALKATILHRVAGYPEERLTTELKVFIKQLKESV